MIRGWIGVEHLRVKRSGWTIDEAIDRIGSEELLRSLCDGRIIAFERADTDGAKPVSSDYWIRRQGAEHPVFAVSPENAGVRNELKILPLLHSPDAAIRLDGVQLRDAVLHFVFGDPEVQASAAKMLLQEAHHAEVFASGRYPRLTLDYQWPLGLNTDDLAWHFAKPAFTVVEGPQTIISAIVRSTAELVVDRWQAFIELLRSGRLEAVGTWMESGELVPINRTQWSRTSLLLDLQGGDLVDEGDGRRPTRSWTGIELKAAADQFHVEPLVRDAVLQKTIAHAPAKSKSAAQSSVEQAVSALWPGGPPAGLLIKQRDAQIKQWIKERGLTVPSSKTISRYFARRADACP